MAERLLGSVIELLEAETGIDHETFAGSAYILRLDEVDVPLDEAA